MNTREELMGLKGPELVGIYNALNPEIPLTQWKQAKSKLVDRILQMQEAQSTLKEIGKGIEPIEADGSGTTVSDEPEPEAAAEATVAEPASETEQNETGNDTAERTIKAASVEWLCHVEYHEDRDEKPSDENRVDPDNKKARSVGLPYDEIIRRIQGEFPDCKTSVACLRWYAVKIRVEEYGYEGLKLPQRRPRVKPTVR